MVARKRNDVVQLSKIRMRESLRQKLARHAEWAGVTLNAEIVKRLDQSFIRDATAERDHAIIEMLVGPAAPHSSSTLLRHIVFKMQQNPNWFRSPTETNKMAEIISDYVKRIPASDPEFLDFEDRI